MRDMRWAANGSRKRSSRFSDGAPGRASRGGRSRRRSMMSNRRMRYFDWTKREMREEVVPKLISSSDDLCHDPRVLSGRKRGLSPVYGLLLRGGKRRKRAQVGDQCVEVLGRELAGGVADHFAHRLGGDVAV